MLELYRKHSLGSTDGVMLGNTLGTSDREIVAVVDTVAIGTTDGESLGILFGITPDGVILGISLGALLVMLKFDASLMRFCNFSSKSLRLRVLDRLPQEDSRLLEAMGFQIHQLDKPKQESFSQLVFDKFLTFNMTTYKRVMFLDADIIPLVNLDYLFHLSDPDYTDLPTVMKPNFIMATRGEPCNTGLFIVEPSEEAYEQYLVAMEEQKERTKTLEYPHFNGQDGWGYNFRKNNDKWEAVSMVGVNWKNFHASHSDQGLMYYLAKFVRKDVSIAIGEKLQNWKKVEGKKRPELESETMGELAKYQEEPLVLMFSCDKNITEGKSAEGKFQYMCGNPPYNSHAHFYGKIKPWKNRWDMKNINDTRSYQRKAAHALWFRELDELNKKMDIGLDLEHWNTKHLPILKNDTLGAMAMWKDQATFFNNFDIKESHISRKHDADADADAGYSASK